MNKKIISIAAFTFLTVTTSFFTLNYVLEKKISNYLTNNNLSYEKIQCSVNPFNQERTTCKIRNLKETNKKQSLSVKTVLIKNPIDFALLENKTLNKDTLKKASYEIIFRGISLNNKNLNDFISNEISNTHWINKEKLIKEINGTNEISIVNHAEKHKDSIVGEDKLNIKLGNLSLDIDLNAEIKDKALPLLKKLKEKKELSINPELTLIKQKLIEYIYLKKIEIDFKTKSNDLFKNTIYINERTDLSPLFGQELSKKIINKLKALNKGETSDFKITIVNNSNLSIKESEEKIILFLMTKDFSKLPIIYKFDIK